MWSGRISQWPRRRADRRGSSAARWVASITRRRFRLRLQSDVATATGGVWARRFRKWTSQHAVIICRWSPAYLGRTLTYRGWARARSRVSARPSPAAGNPRSRPGPILRRARGVGRARDRPRAGGDTRHDQRCLSGHGCEGLVLSAITRELMAFVSERLAVGMTVCLQLAMERLNGDRYVKGGERKNDFDGTTRAA